MKELWKVVPGHPEYEASTGGRVRRLASRKRSTVGMILPTWFVGKPTYPYPSVALGDHGSVALHRIILTTFRGPRQKNEQARHLNGNRFDNRLCNLRWGTRKQNTQDRIKHGGYK